MWLAPAAIAVTPLPSAMAVTGTLLGATKLFPSCPFVFTPQHFTPPFTTAQVCSVPAATAVAPETMPLTVTGTAESVVVLLPSWPDPLNPQQRTWPPATAQACRLPEASADAPEVSGVAAIGVATQPVKPVPSCPWRFLPKHWTVALGTVPTTTQVCIPPAATKVAPDEGAASRSGEVDDEGDAAPSWRYALSPQQRIAPPATTAQLCPPPAPTSMPPAATAVTPESAGLTATGDVLSIVERSPSWPDAL